MLYRKIRSYIDDYLRSNEDKILLVEGARQIGKSYIIRDVGTELYDNYVEINFVEDDAGDRIFKNVRTTEEFYLNLSMVAGSKLDRYENTLVFIDEIQHYPQFLTMLISDDAQVLEARTPVSVYMQRKSVGNCIEKDRFGPSRKYYSQENVPAGL